MSLWTVFFKSHPINSTDSNSDNLLQDYFMNCITVCLKTEVIEEFYELPGDEQGAPLLIYLALTKLHSSSPRQHYQLQDLQNCL